MLLHSYKLLACGCERVTSWSGGTMLLLLSGTREIRQSRVVGSLHPLKMISPLSEISQPVRWKNNSQPASASVAAETRLWAMPGALCAILAAGGSLWSKRCRSSVVKSLSPFGCMTDFG